MAAWVVLCGIASAERIEIHQGDIVYMNETVDISLAVSWPDYTLAWCANDNYECDPPDKVIEVTGNMHQYYIGPDKFNYGTYYRWDGEWHRGENAIAFTIVQGARNDNHIFSTEEERNAPGKIAPIEGPFNYYISRGDNPLVSTRLNRTDACYLWVFSDNMDVLGERMVPVYEGDGYTSYTYTFSDQDTMNISVDTYQARIVCAGKNRVMDVYMDGPVMTTPYKATKDIAIDSWNPYKIREKYDNLAATIPDQLYDDVVYNIGVTVVEPYVAITSIERDDDDTKLYISGVTSWENQTALTFKLDPDNYKLAQDIRFHTWTTTAAGSLDAPRKFATALSLEKEELSVGMHEIISFAEKNTDVGYSAYSFRISDIRVMPTPTPYIRRVLQMEDSTEMPVRTTVTLSVTAEITKAYSNVTVQTNTTPTVNVTVAETTATAIPVPTATTPVVVPVPAWISVAAIATVIMVMRK